MFETFFKILHNAKNISLKLKDFNLNTEAVVFADGDDLEIGLYKPFRFLYVALETAVTNGAIASFSYWNGTEYVVIEGIQDETFGLTKSGFIMFPELVGHAEHNGQFFIRVNFDIATEFILRGINVLFSDDSDLTGIRENIVSKHNGGSPWLAKHEATRNYMVQRLNNQGHVKVAERASQYFGNVVYRDEINAFDFLDPYQLRVASAYKTMSMIYLDELSDEIDDKWYRQGVRYVNDFEALFEGFLLKLDKNDDGIPDDDELDNEAGTVLKWE